MMWLRLPVLYIFYSILNLCSCEQGCTTPKSAAGQCVLLPKCASLLRLLQKQPISPENLRYLQQSTCDSSGSEPTVCCPLSELPTTTTTTPKPPPTQRTPAPTQRTTQKSSSTNSKDVTQHKNVNLLPNSEACGKSDPIEYGSDRISGGKDAGLGTYPWMALIGYTANVDGQNSAVQFACGGTLINSRYILTAAHCIAQLPEGFMPTVVRLGEYNQSAEVDCFTNPEGRQICAPKYQDMKIEEIIPHENYDKSGKKENDIAIIRLQQHVALGPFVSPVCLPHGERLQQVLRKPKPVVAGWGRLTSENPDGSTVLQYVAVPFRTMDVCNEVYGTALGSDVDEGRFCAGGEKGKDSCQGDSGGPLMLALKAKNVNWQIRVFQYGVVSLGPKNCDSSSLPALYTKVSYFMGWILDHMKP